MVDIRFDKSMIPITEYKELLEERVSIICNKIKYHNNQIKWIIFNPYIKDISEDARISDVLKSFCTYRNGSNIGYSICEKNEIYISSFAIECSLKLQNDSIIKMVSNYITIPPKTDLLDKVILDELAHIKSQENHGGKKYEDTLKTFQEAYDSHNE